MDLLVKEESKDRREVPVPQDQRVSKVPTDSVASPEKWVLLELKVPQGNQEVLVLPGPLVPPAHEVPPDHREGKEMMEKRASQDLLSVL